MNKLYKALDTHTENQKQPKMKRFRVVDTSKAQLTLLNIDCLKNYKNASTSKVSTYGRALMFMVTSYKLQNSLNNIG